MKLIGVLVGLCLSVSAMADHGSANKYVVFTDKNGNGWTAKLKGRYTNGCEKQWNNEHYEIVCSPVIDAATSDAAAACAEIGGKLPTAQDYKNLVKNFDTTDDGEMTETGFQQMQQAFAGGMFDAFNTSTLFYNHTSQSGLKYQYSFFGALADDDGIVDYGFVASEESHHRDVALAVQCVFYPQK